VASRQWSWSRATSRLLGLYLARALSFAGIEYDILRHDLSIDQIAIYDTYCEAWTIIHQNLEAALELTGVVDSLENRTLNSGAKAARAQPVRGDQAALLRAGPALAETALDLPGDRRTSGARRKRGRPAREHRGIDP